MPVLKSIRGTLSLGKNISNKGLSKTIDDIYKKYIAGGGKKKTVTKVVKNKKPSVKELASKAKEKINIKSKINKAKEAFSRKEYNKKLFDILKKRKNNKISKNKNKQSTELVPISNKGTNVVKRKSTELVPISNKGTNVVERKGTNVVNISNKGTNVVIPKNVTTKAGKLAYLKKHFKNNWKKYAVGLGLVAAPFLIPKDNTSKSSVINKNNKDKNPPKDFIPKIKKPFKPEVKIKELPKVKSNDYTGRFIDKKGDVAYDSPSDFLAHMFGTPKKRAMPKKTARILGGTGNKLKRKEADTKGAGKGVKFKAFKSGTKDKTIAKPKSLKNVMNKKIKDAEKKDSTFGMLMTSVNYPELFKRITKKSGGGLIAGLYDKPEKTEKYKGNSTSARQVKGYGKARKP
tara:strand:- start:4385 stop:5590 length:1206 start_codon:yes stop_codon:yes gene_type:complete